MQRAAIVLAAGVGTRMQSKKPKVAHKILGKPLVRWVVDAAHAAGIQRVVSVVGHARDQVIPLVEADTHIVVQQEQNGTADAVYKCAEVLAGFEGSLVVLSGDCPLVTPETIKLLVKTREQSNAAAVVLTMKPNDPFGYGRIVRTSDGSVAYIVEQKDATPEEAAIGECNSGFYCFDTRILFESLQQVDNNNAQGEFYLTDVLEICRNANHVVQAVVCENAEECMGVNTRVQLAEAAKSLQHRINAMHMANGVTMTDPNQVWIGPNVILARDVELLPQTFLMGATCIGEDSIIGPNSRLTDTVVGCNCVLDETVAVEALLDNNVSCGPRAYLRPGAHLCDGSKVGTHVEIKKSTIGKDSKVPHLTYLGDATIGEGVNIGAGSITCNYDGKRKWPTVVGDGAFIGSDTMMVAPVAIGAGAIIGAGSCITKDVMPDSLALTRPEQCEISGWAARKRARQAQE